MKMSIEQFEENLAKDDGLSYHYIEGDLTVPFTEVLKHQLLYVRDLYDLTEAELTTHVKNLDHDHIKSMTETEVKKWLIKHSQLSPNDILDHYRSVMVSLYGEDSSRYQEGMENFARFVNLFYKL